jgi:hypothetical protein
VSGDQNIKGDTAEPEMHATCQFHKSTVGITDKEVCLEVPFDRYNKPLNVTSEGPMQDHTSDSTRRRRLNLTRTEGKARTSTIAIIYHLLCFISFDLLNSVT